MIKHLQNLVPKETICKQINKPSRVEGACISKQCNRHLVLWAMFSVLTACPGTTISYWDWKRASNTTNWDWFWLFCHMSFFLLSQSNAMALSFFKKENKIPYRKNMTFIYKTLWILNLLFFLFFSTTNVILITTMFSTIIPSQLVEAEHVDLWLFTLVTLMGSVGVLLLWSV